MNLRIISKTFLLLIGVCALASGPPTVQAQSLLEREYQIKAGFLYNFLKFIEWPSDVLPETSGTINICVLGDELAREAFESLNGKMVKDRRLAVRRLEPVKDLLSCHVLFIGASEEKRFPQIMQSLRGLRVLTVGEIERFAQSGGIINFVTERNKVRFEINVDSAARAGLKVSSQLLSLAKVVRQ